MIWAAHVIATILYEIHDTIFMLSNLSSDIDECLSGPCENGGTCTDEVNGYICSCVAGYTGTLCETGILLGRTLYVNNQYLVST